MTRIIETVLADGTPATRLDRYLSARFDYLSRSAWQREIEGGRVSINRTSATNPARKVKGGDLVSYDGRDIKEPPVDESFTILYSDEYFTAVNKSGDLPIHPAGRYFNNTLTMILEKRHSRKYFPVHRLDRETSGVILLAHDSESASKLSDAISDGQKEYIALVHGYFDKDEIRIDLPIGNDADSAVMKKRKAFAQADESALTIVRRVSTFGKYSIVRCIPETGRLHQIRVHLLSAGFPIVGDKIYGTDDRMFIEFIESGMTDELAKKLILTRCALHAVKLSFMHPYLKKEMIISAPLPLMFKNFISSERKNG